MNIIHAPSVALSAKSADGAGLKWVHVAYEGEWSGHHAGRFRFTREIFERLVANFQRHPKYGHGRVIAYDLHHGSEMPLQSKVEHTLAHAWAHDLQVRNGASGKGELWALTEYLDHTREWIRKGQIGAVSAAVCFDGIDPVTGESIGPVLTSIAFTNQPFLQGLRPLAASQNPAAQRHDTEPTMQTIPKTFLSILCLSALATESDFETKLRAVVDENRKLNEDNPKLAKRNAELEEENKKLLAWKTEYEAKQAEADVDALIGAKPALKDARAALLSFRKADPDGFVKQYPKPTEAPMHPALKQEISSGQFPQMIAATGQAQPLRLDQLQVDPQTGKMFVPLSAPAAHLGSAPAAASNQKLQLLAAIAAMPGVNKHDQAMKYVRQNGGKDLSHEEAHAQACVLLAQANVPKNVVHLSELNLG